MQTVDAAGFYDRLGDDYDDMTAFAARLERERPAVAALVRRFGIRRATDVACGSGVHALLLAEAGVATTGVDISRELLAGARGHAESRGVNIDWQAAPMQQLASLVCAQDAVLCLGNSLPHLLSATALQDALIAFFRALKPGGVAIVQLLNYDRVLDLRERLVGGRRCGTTDYLRFYDFLPERLRFNLLRLRWSANGTATVDWSATELYPYRQEELLRALAAAGFAEADCFADLSLAPFEAAESSNLVIVARRPEPGTSA